MKYELKPVGTAEYGENGFTIKVLSEYREALAGLKGFSWLNIIWWADQFDSEDFRILTTADKPYRKGPEKLGLFATRSPIRPNPLAVTAVYVTRIDFEKGIVYTPYIDAENGTPVLDIKPYLGCSDRVSRTETPEWCSDWPETVEESADFDWDSVFNF